MDKHIKSKIFCFFCFSTNFLFFPRKNKLFLRKNTNFYETCTWFLRNLSMPKNVQKTEALVRRCSLKKVFLEISQNSQEFSFLIKLQACNFIKKELLHRCFSANFVKFLRTPILTEQLWWLLLRRTFPNFLMYDPKHIQENYMKSKNISTVKSCLQ